HDAGGGAGRGNRGEQRKADADRQVNSPSPHPPTTPAPSFAARHRTPEHRRRRMRRHGRKAYVRSVYYLPGLATLGNAVGGFAAMYVAAFDDHNVGTVPWARALLANKFLAAAYLIVLAMIFDALDGRLARFARHTTDFGGQLD